MRGTVRLGMGALLAATASLAATAPAPAAVNCNFAAATAAITADAPGNTAVLGRGVSPADAVEAAGSQCGSATVTTTDTITFTDTSGSNTKLIAVLGNGPLAPGLTDESGGSDEIETTASFGSGGTEFDLLEVDGCSGAPCASADDHIVWGSGGINLNADEAPAVDADVTQTGAEVYQGNAGSGNDTLAADGGFGTGIAALIPVQLSGFGGMDLLTGGAAADSLSGGAENDEILGGAADDNIEPGPGDDQVDGEGGSFDIVNFSLAANGVSVDLSDGGAQGTGEGTDLILGMESMIGSSFDDPLLSGTTAPNNIQGGAGNDRIVGLDGGDSLSGGDGSDVIDGGPDDDLVGDQIVGGDGTDTAAYGDATGVRVSLAKAGAQETLGAGVDTLTAIENLSGSPGADRLTGDGTANLLKARGGKDRLKGGQGKDVLKAGGGADRVRSRDGEGDTVRCGGGHDVVKADAHDKLAGCEDKHVA